MTRCQAVEDRVVLAFLIQPVLPFGRPGSLTRSQRVPPLSVRWPITGSTVRPSVIGRMRSTQTRRAERLSGFAIAVCPCTNTASSWVRATVGVVPAGAGRRGPGAGEESQRRRRTTNRGARVRTPVAELMKPGILAREAGGVDRRQSRAADARRATGLPSGRLPRERRCSLAAAAFFAAAASRRSGLLRRSGPRCRRPAPARPSPRPPVRPSPPRLRRALPRRPWPRRLQRRCCCCRRSGCAQRLRRCCCCRCGRCRVDVAPAERRSTAS